MAVPDRRLQGFLRHDGLTRVANDGDIHIPIFGRVVT